MLQGKEHAVGDSLEGVDDEEETRLVCACTHRLFLSWSARGERLGFLRFFDDEPKSATYGQRIQDCPGCERLGLPALFSAGRGGKPSGEPSG